MRTGIRGFHRFAREWDGGQLADRARMLSPILQRGGWKRMEGTRGDQPFQGC